MCEDDFVLMNGECVGSNSAKLIRNNHPLKCARGMYMTNEQCLQCGESCVACFATACAICEAKVNNEGSCVEPPNAVVATNNGIVACDDGSTLKDGGLSLHRLSLHHAKTRRQNSASRVTGALLGATAPVWSAQHFHPAGARATAPRSLTVFSARRVGTTAQCATAACA